MRTTVGPLSSLLFAATALAAPAIPPAAPDAAPVAYAIAVSPATAHAGEEVTVTVKLTPQSGIKLNKYPKIKLQIPAVPGLTESAEGAIGNPAPPPADHLDANYYKGGVDPLVVKVRLDASAAAGDHQLAAKLSYFYCVAASGYCAPAKVDVSVPIAVR